MVLAIVFGVATVIMAIFYLTRSTLFNKITSILAITICAVVFHSALTNYLNLNLITKKYYIDSFGVEGNSKIEEKKDYQYYFTVLNEKSEEIEVQIDYDDYIEFSEGDKYEKKHCMKLMNKGE